MEDLTALFHQYETDYCNKSTEISRKISAIASITGGVWVQGLKHDISAALLSPHLPAGVCGDGE
jgi:hypothetical protein